MVVEEKKERLVVKYSRTGKMGKIAKKIAIATDKHCSPSENDTEKPTDHNGKGFS